jgi:polyphosphate kinase
VFVGSADWMPRNLRHRVEILYPIEDAAIRDRIRVEILGTYLADRVKARRILPDGSHERVTLAPGEAPIRSQAALLETAAKLAGRLVERADSASLPTEEPARTRARRRRKSASQQP